MHKLIWHGVNTRRLGCCVNVRTSEYIPDGRERDTPISASIIRRVGHAGVKEDESIKK